MPIYELKSPVTSGAIGALEELLAEREDQRWMVVEDRPAVRAWLTGYFESAGEAEAAWNAIRGSSSAGLIGADREIRELPDTEWKDSYRIHFKAWKFGPLNWVPVWERATFTPPAGELVLWLDPGMAFGTGNHETTRLVVERLIGYRERRGTGGRVIDVGCGSGILALSAARLGFRNVLAFDNDPEAVRVSEENAALNELEGQVEFFTGDLVNSLAGQQADLILANIQADVLMRFATDLLGAAGPKGELVLSGILANELDQVQKTFLAAAPVWTVESRTLGEWSDLVLVHSND